MIWQSQSDICGRRLISGLQPENPNSELDATKKLKILKNDDSKSLPHGPSHITSTSTSFQQSQVSQARYMNVGATHQHHRHIYPKKVLFLPPPLSISRNVTCKATWRCRWRSKPVVGRDVSIRAGPDRRRERVYARSCRKHARPSVIFRRSICHKGDWVGITYLRGSVKKKRKERTTHL